MSKYRKKPVVIEAFKLGVDCIPDWFMDAVTANEVILHGNSRGFDHCDDTNADIHTLEGWHHANNGDYIIRGVKGEIYPCKPDIFDMTYKAVDMPKTNADRIRAMSDEELAKFLDDLAFARETPWADPFARKFCDNCPTVRCTVEVFGQEMEFNECDFVDGKCPHGDDILWWLKEPYEKGETK